MARKKCAQYFISVILLIIIPKLISASDYVFKVYATEACPKDQIEMDERSLALNCTESNGYTCLPNENLTMLLEFCYKRPRIAVTKGLCLFLRHSDVDAYDCQRFDSGCPDVDYYSDELYNYPNCVSIGSRCFLADTSCKRISEALTKSTANIVTTSSNDLDQNTDIPVWLLIAISVSAFMWIVTCTCLVLITYKKRTFMKTVNEPRSSEILLPYNDCEQELDSQVTPMLNGIDCQERSDETERLSMDDPTDKIFCVMCNGEYSPSKVIV